MLDVRKSWNSGCDANTEPEDLCKTLWFQMLGAVIVAAEDEAGTHRVCVLIFFFFSGLMLSLLHCYTAPPRTKVIHAVVAFTSQCGGSPISIFPRQQSERNFRFGIVLFPVICGVMPGSLTEFHHSLQPTSHLDIPRLALQVFVVSWCTNVFECVRRNKGFRESSFL